MLRRNILLFHNAALGDFVLTWPLAMALARLFAQSRVMYITASQKGQLAERVLNVEYRDIEAGWHALYGDPAALPETARKTLAGAQLVIAFSAGTGDAWLNNVRSIVGDAPVIVLQPNPDDGGAHVTQHQLAQLISLPAVRSFAEQALQLVASRGLAAGRKVEADVVVLAPGSGSEAKNWPIECYDKLATKLLAAHKRVRVILGETELDRWPAATRNGWSPGVAVIECRSALELFAAIEPASVYVGNDSGPTHLAAMIGVPTVALFGPTDAIVWHPIGPAVRVAAAAKLTELSVEDVFALTSAVTLCT